MDGAIAEHYDEQQCCDITTQQHQEASKGIGRRMLIPFDTVCGCSPKTVQVVETTFGITTKSPLNELKNDSLPKLSAWNEFGI